METSPFLPALADRADQLTCFAVLAVIFEEELLACQSDERPRPPHLQTECRALGVITPKQYNIHDNAIS